MQNKITRKISLLALSTILSYSGSYGQVPSRTITGIIVSQTGANPLEGVSVFAKISNRYSGSQADGIYYINVNGADSVLIFSQENYQTQEIKLTAASEYNITLKESVPRQPNEATEVFSPFG